MTDMFKPFSMMEIFKAWTNSGQAFEQAAEKYAEAKDKAAEISQSMVKSEEGKRVQDLVSQISALNMELASAMTDYNTRLVTGTLTSLKDEE